MIQNTPNSAHPASTLAVQAAAEAVRRAERAHADAQASGHATHLASSGRVVENHRQRQSAAVEANRSSAPPVPPRSSECSPRNRVRAHSLSQRPQVAQGLRPLFATMIERALDRLHAADCDCYAAGIQALWPTNLQPDVMDLAPAVDEAVLILRLLRAKFVDWPALQELRYFNKVLFMQPHQRQRVRLLVEELWLPTTFWGAMDDLARLAADGPDAGAYLDERRRFVEHAPIYLKADFAERNGAERNSLHAAFPKRERDTRAPEPLEASRTTIPDFPSPLSRCFSALDLEENPFEQEIEKP